MLDQALHPDQPTNADQVRWPIQAIFARAFPLSFAANAVQLAKILRQKTPGSFVRKNSSIFFELFGHTNLYGLV
jgi:hypothetical protein